jgi:GT2 family glycosyltransferase
MADEIGGVGFVIVAYRNDAAALEGLSSCLLQAADSLGHTAGVYLVMNDDQEIPDIPGVRVIQGHGNVGFAAGIRRGVLAADEDYLVLVNPDCLPDLEQFRAFLKRITPGTIAVPMLHKEDGTFDYMPYENWTYTPGRMLAARLCRRRLPSRADEHLPWYAKIPGAFVGMPRSTALELNAPFDADYFLYAEDRDLTDRVRAEGIAITLLRDVRVTHLGGESGKTVSNLVAKSKADGSLRVSFRRYGRPGALIFAIDQWLCDTIKHRLGRQTERDAHKWSIARWRAAGFSDPGPLNEHILTS